MTALRITPLTSIGGQRWLRMIERNLLVYKHGWMVIVSGFFEPLFYLLSLGLGVGAMVPRIGEVSYAAFVAPGLYSTEKSKPSSLPTQWCCGMVAKRWSSRYFKL